MTVSSPIGSPSTVSATAITTASRGEDPRASSRPSVASRSRTTVGPRRCGSPVAQAHSRPRGTAIATIPGRHRCATCTSSARAADLASADGPTMPIPPTAGASTGAPSRRAACSSSSWSSASTGVPSTRRTLRAVPRPSTRCPGSPSRQSSGAPVVEDRARRRDPPPRRRALELVSRGDGRAQRHEPLAALRRPLPLHPSALPPHIQDRGDGQDRAEGGEDEGERRARDRPEHDRAADRGDRGDPWEAGNRRFRRVRRQRERHARRVGDVGEVGEVGLVSFHSGIRSSAADADSTDRPGRGVADGRRTCAGRVLPRRRPGRP